MEILKFKTNVKSEDEIAQVASFLNLLENIHNWHIDPDSDENTLIVSGEKLDPQQVKTALEQAGYKAEIIRVIGTSGEDL